MKPKNKSLLPKYNKYTHKEILDLSGDVVMIRKVPILPFWLCTGAFLGFISLIVPDLGLCALLGIYLIRRKG